MQDDYRAFLDSKAPIAQSLGIDPGSMPNCLFDFAAYATEICLRRGRAALFLDCLGGESTILTANGPIRIDEATEIGQPLTVVSLAGSGQPVTAKATVPFRKGRAAIYRVETKQGRVLVGTAGHRILTSNGWTAIRDLAVQDALPGYVQSRLPSILEHGPSVSQPSVLRSARTDEDSMGHCSTYSHLYDPLLLRALDIDRSFSPSQADAPELGLLTWRSDDLARKSTHIHSQGIDRLSMRDYAPQGLNVADAPGCLPHSFGSGSSDCYNQTSSPVPSISNLQMSIDEFRPSEGLLSLVGQSSAWCIPDYVASIHYIRFDDFYDIHVPGYENYFGDGFISHNTGLTKTRCQLEFSRQAIAASNGVGLILTPLAVARQFEKEGLSLGYDCRVIRDQSDVRPGINIVNYDRLDKLSPAEFGCVCLDESSSLKNFTGKLSRTLINAFANTPFRLCATATPAPNDHVELGTHSEFLGIMPQSDMLIRWFINDSNDTGTWRLKKHAREAFWDWVSSWAVMASSPEDLGFDGSRFILPPMNVHRHKAIGEIKPMDGMLFAGDVSATNMHAVKRQTAQARSAEVAKLVAAEPDEPWMVFCDTDVEADCLMSLIPEAVEVRGSMTPEKKETAIASFLEGERRVMISKPSIMGAGLNMQFCARMAFVGRTFSYEMWYQAVRRCWRFGQKRPVDVHLIVAEGEDQIGRTIDRKQEAHAEMKEAMIAASRSAIGKQYGVKIKYTPCYEGRVPEWMVSCAA